ncbi:MAG: recombinase RecB [Desulfurococcales archaeon]|nr:recombinase RecB [Desulfurococcales archaeon]
MRGKRLWRASEAAAIALLEDMGFEIVDVRRPLIVGGLEVSDIDVVAKKGDTVYAVEVKAGSADVSAIRQAYTNAILAGGLKPMVIARGADDKARAVAEELGVELVLLPDILVAGYEDLRMAVREAILSLVYETAEIIGKVCSNEITERERKIVEAVAHSDTIREAAEALGLEVEELGREISRMRKKGMLPNANYNTIKLVAKLALLLCPKRE